MADISVSAQGDGTFKVRVDDGRNKTSHEVTAPAGLAADVGTDTTTDEELVRESFVFLLEHEPASSILRRFSLDVIGDYFPEYKSVMRSRLRSGEPAS